MSYTIIIPARMHSTRLPGKPLADICGKPMVVRTAERARLTSASRIVVATDHPDIVRACEQHSIEALLTRADHPTGTDRLSEACQQLGLNDDELVVNIQGDEPLIPPNIVDKAASLLAQKPGCAIATAAHPISSLEDFLNPNVVKVELNAMGQALAQAAPRRVQRPASHRPLRLSGSVPQEIPRPGARSDRDDGEPGAAARALERRADRRARARAGAAARR